MYFKHEVTPVVHVHSGVLRVHVLRCSTVYDSPPPPPLGRPVIDRADTLLGGISLFFENSRERKGPRENCPFSPVCKFHAGIYDPTVLFIRRVLITNYVTRFTCVRDDMKIATRLLYTYVCATREAVSMKLRRTLSSANLYGMRF